MSASERLQFNPKVSAPEDIQGEVRCFAFRRRELLVTVDFELPALPALDAAGLDSLRSQYLIRAPSLSKIPEKRTRESISRAF